MLRFIIRRPIAVIMIFIAFIITGAILSPRISISLLPDIDVPQIVIKLGYQNMPAAEIEEQIVKPLRSQLINTRNLQDIESMVADHTGQLLLTFDYGTRMNLAYIEVNEKLDRFSGNFPKDMERPRVAKVNTSDIPAIRIQVLPKKGTDMIATSTLCENILKKRIEQLPGVAMADINGIRKKCIYMYPYKQQLHSLGIDQQTLVNTINDAQYANASLMLHDGPHNYFVRLDESLYSVHELRKMPVRINNNVVPMDRLARFEEEPASLLGFHLYNGKESVVITVQKQPEFRMNDLMPDLAKLVSSFTKDYSQLEFTVTQDQSFLLDASIDNLYQDIIYGGMITIFLLFIFNGNWITPTLMGISIPISLILTVILFYLFNISFNILSLSGLALGIGMLIDNSIVVIDNIGRHHRNGSSAEDSAADGTTEVIVPVISQVLTTVAVYLPLVLLGGIAGSIIFDQSIALSISLGISLLVSFFLLPVLYRLAGGRETKNNRETVIYRWILKRYHRMISVILRKKKLFIGITLFTISAGNILIGFIPIKMLPALDNRESLIHIDWNEPINAEENLFRTTSLLGAIDNYAVQTEAEVGIQQFLQQLQENGIQETDIYIKHKSSQLSSQVNTVLQNWLQRHYPQAIIRVTDAPNAFTQLFVNSTPYFTVKLRPITNASMQQIQAALKQLSDSLSNYRPTFGEGKTTETAILLDLNIVKLGQYRITRQHIEKTLQELMSQSPVGELKQTGEIAQIRLTNNKTSLNDVMNAWVKNESGSKYQIKEFVHVRLDEKYKYVVADKSGVYYALNFEEPGIRNVPSLEEEIREKAKSLGLRADFSGKYYDSKEYIKLLGWIFLLVLTLLYFILAIQYEDLLLPVIVMLTIPLGTGGGLLLLWITGGSLNVMSAIGFIVVLGLIVDDPILKVQTLISLKKKYTNHGHTMDESLMKKIIHEAGDICLRPLLMVSLTTSLAMVPILFIGGIGNDLQKPMAIVIIGGLTIGTFFTSWFIPLAFLQLYKWRIKT